MSAFAAALLGVPLVFTSCALHFAPPVLPQATVTPRTAIIYGRFSTSSDVSAEGKVALRRSQLLRRTQCGFLARNIDTKRQYVLPFWSADSIYGSTVPPGRYTITGFVVTVDHIVAGEALYQAPMPSLDLRPNSVTYIGDFKGDVRFLSSDDMEWRLSGFTNNYAQTTEEFHDSHLNLLHSAFGCATETIKSFQANSEIYEQKILARSRFIDFYYIDDNAWLFAIPDHCHR